MQPALCVRPTRIIKGLLLFQVGFTWKLLRPATKWGLPGVERRGPDAFMLAPPQARWRRMPRGRLQYRCQNKRTLVPVAENRPDHLPARTLSDRAGSTLPSTSPLPHGTTTRPALISH